MAKGKGAKTAKSAEDEARELEEALREQGDDFAEDMKAAMEIAIALFGGGGTLELCAPRETVLGVWRRIAGLDEDDREAVVEELKNARTMALASEKVLSGDEYPRFDLVFEVFDEISDVDDDSYEDD